MLVDTKHIRSLIRPTDQKWMFKPDGMHNICEVDVFGRDYGYPFGTMDERRAKLAIELRNAASELLDAYDEVTKLRAEVEHHKAHLKRIREAGGWDDEFENTPYLVSCLAGERNALRRVVKDIEWSGVQSTCPSCRSIPGDHAAACKLKLSLER